MTAFTITVTHPDGTRQVRSFPAAYSAEAALRWATMIRTRDGYTADTTEAEAAAAMVPQLRRAEAERRSGKSKKARSL